MAERKEDGQVSTETEQKPDLSHAQAVLDAIQSGDLQKLAESIKALAK